MSTELPQTEKPPVLATVKRIAVGAGMLGLAMGGATLATEGALDLEHKIALTTNEAQPSDTLATAFDILETTGAGLGALVLAKRGLHHLRTVENPADTALYSMAHAGAGKRRVIKIATSASLLTAASGVMIGNFGDTADAVSHSQSKVGGFLTNATGDKQAATMLTNTPRPELANTATINPAAVEALTKQAAVQGVNVVPVRWEWHPATRPNKPDAKIQVLSVSMPPELTGLPAADENCDNVSVAAAKELGIKAGDSFSVDGLSVRVSKVLSGSAGLNLLPVLFNNDDFARCVDTNPSQPFNAVLSDATMRQAQELLTASGFSASNLSERVFAVPTETFIADTLQTGKNSVNGLVLQAMALGLLFGGVALSGKVSNELIANRENNRMLKVNGFSERMIARLYTEKAEADAIQSSLFAIPGVFLVDAFTNTGEPGAALGPSIQTYLGVLGLTWGVKRLGTSIAVRKERGLEEKGLGE